MEYQYLWHHPAGILQTHTFDLSVIFSITGAAYSNFSRALGLNNLSGTIPPELGALGSLQVLCVSASAGTLLTMFRYMNKNWLTGTIPPELFTSEDLTLL